MSWSRAGGHCERAVQRALCTGRKSRDAHHAMFLPGSEENGV